MGLALNKIKFILPPRGTFEVNGPSDPLDYYYRSIVGKLYVSRIQQGLNLLKPPYQSILEFGSGSGLLLPSLASAANKLTAVDKDADPIFVKQGLAKLNVSVDVYQQEITLLQLPAASFDLIVAFSVFEHIQDSCKILKEFYRLLTPNGQLLVGMPRVDKLMEGFFMAIGFNNINNFHVSNYKNFLHQSSPYFLLKQKVHIPRFFPEKFGLYFNMLFIKRAIA